MKILFHSLVFTISLFHTLHVVAAERDRTVQIIGRKDAVVTTGDISLADIASVSSNRLIDDEAVIGLKKIPLQKSPGPGETATLSAAGILERLRESGVDLNNVAYTLPRIIVVKRAAREITTAEIKEAIDAFIKTSGRDMEVKSITFPKSVFVLPGDIKFSVQPAQSISGSQQNFGVIAKVVNATPIRFEAVASVNEWKEVPVAKRAIARGEVIADEDLMMARFNMTAIPKDAALLTEKVVGLRVNADLSYGELFRRQKLAIPSVIETGSRVTMVYKSRLLEASAKGTALEAGAVGQEIKVRNDTSRKTVVGKVRESGIVEVIP